MLRKLRLHITTRCTYEHFTWDWLARGKCIVIHLTLRVWNIWNNRILTYRADACLSRFLSLFRFHFYSRCRLFTSPKHTSHFLRHGQRYSDGRSRHENSTRQRSVLGRHSQRFATKEIRDYFRKMVVRMNKKFCHLENEQIMNSQSLLRYVDNFFNTLLLILWDHSDRQIDGR